MYDLRRVTPASAVLSCHHRGVTDIADGKLRVARRPAQAVAIAVARPTAAPTRAEAAGSVWVRGAFAAAWSAALGLGLLLVVSLILLTTDSRATASAGDAARLATQLWLVAHRSPLQVPGGVLSMPPLALTLALGLIVARASAIVARASRCADVRALGPVVISVALPYAVIAAVLAGVVRTGTLRPSPGAAFVCAALVSGLFASLGATRGAGLGREAWQSVPLRLQVPLQAAGTAAILLLAAASLLTVGSILAHLHRFTSVVNGYAGAPGEISMLLLSLALVPNAAIFGLGYLTGPGFAVGTGTAVAIGSSHVAAVPALPLLTAVPAGRAPWPVLAWCVLAVVVAGIAAGRRITRSSTLDLTGRLQSVVVAAAALGVVAAVVTGFAGGPAGPGRLRAFGPSPWQVGLAVAGETAVVAALAVLAAALISSRAGFKREKSG